MQLRIIISPMLILRRTYMYYDCIVIGGGAAGMTAAITASKNGLSTCILEHMDKMGKKILQTGNGKCNLTNTVLNKNCYLCDDTDFVMEVIDKFDVDMTIDFFKKIGIYPKSKNGYIYPNSEQASSVLEVLRIEVEHQGVTVNTGIKVIKAEPFKVESVKVEPIKIDKNISKTSTPLFKITTSEGIFTANSLIIATGSKASPKSGSDGSGYILAESFGHTVIKPLPALVQLRSDLKLCKAMSGVRSEGTVSLVIDGKLVASDTGEIQYTDYGISGIPVFQISRFAVRAVDEKKKTEVHIDMFPSEKKEDLLELINSRKEIDGHKTLEQFFEGMLNRKLICAVLNRISINPSDKVNEVLRWKPDTFERIVTMIKTFVVPINGFNSFENGQICSGGADTKEIKTTMESKLIKNLYFAGEIVDVDGLCGGYNLQWAWSSGYVAGINAAKNRE